MTTILRFPKVIHFTLPGLLPSSLFSCLLFLRFWRDLRTTSNMAASIPSRPRMDSRIAVAMQNNEKSQVVVQDISSDDSDRDLERSRETVVVDASSREESGEAAAGLQRSVTMGSIGNQRNLLSRTQLITSFAALSVSLFVSFIDQTAVSTSIPAISAELNTGSSTAWIGASFLISSTAFQLINGRLSDIFGRKSCLLICLGLLGLGDLICGFSKTKEQLFAFRAIAGIGGGGVNSIVMIIVSDISTLENRGKFQGWF